MSFLRYLLLIGYMVAGVGIGSKALFVITQIPKWLESPTFQNLIHIVWTSGFVFYGGLFGAIAGVVVFAKQYHMAFEKLADLTAPGFPLFHFWGRIGCFFAGCCYGKEANWGVAMASTPDILRIPIQLIEAVCILFIFGMLLYIERKNVGVSVLRLYLGAYAFCRSILEFYRGDTLRGLWLGLSTSQWISIIILLYLTASFFFSQQKQTSQDIH